jgi:hypothetical protein
MMVDVMIWYRDCECLVRFKRACSKSYGIKKLGSDTYGGNQKSYQISLVAFLNLLACYLNTVFS